ncbi:HNH endonuclease signature motif containing protein [Microbacterium sp. R1]
MQRRFGGRCAYCGVVAVALTMDHVVPIVRGGTHSAGNIVPACMSCNVHKQGRFITEWKYGRSRRVA